MQRVVFDRAFPRERVKADLHVGEGFPTMSDEVLVKVEGVSKKFCRSLKLSLWYGVQDVIREQNFANR